MIFLIAIAFLSISNKALSSDYSGYNTMGIIKAATADQSPPNSARTHSPSSPRRQLADHVNIPVEPQIDNENACKNRCLFCSVFCGIATAGTAIAIVFTR